MNGWKFFPSYSGACGAFGRDGVKVNAVSFVYYQAVDGIYAMPLSETEAAREALTPVSENAFYDSEAVAWALGKLEAFGCQTKIESAMMMDRLKLMLLGTPPSASVAPLISQELIKGQSDKDESATPRTGWWVEFQRGWWKQGLGPAKDRGLKEQSSAIYHGSVTDEQAKELEHIFRDYLETRAQPPRLTAYGMRDFIARAIAYWKSESGERAEREAAELVAMLEHDGRKQSATLALATEKGLTPTGQRIADLERDAARYRWLRDASSWLGFQWYDDARRLQEFNRSAGRPEMIDEKIDEQLSTSYVPGSIK